MKTKVNIKIDVSTYSYIMGGQDLMQIERMLPEEIRESVNIQGALNLDEGQQDAKPPYATVDGKFVSEATPEKITALVKALL